MVPQIDYNDVVGVTEEEFWDRARYCAVLAGRTERDAEVDADIYRHFTKSDEEDIAKIERLLDVREGTLTCEDNWLERIECECGRVLTIYDFVFTGLVDAGHSKSLILHTFLGTKYVLNRPRAVRCSNCARIHQGGLIGMASAEGGLY
jgi:hypothetical protein